MKKITKNNKKKITVAILLAAVIVVIVAGLIIKVLSNMVYCSVNKESENNIVLNTSIEELKKHNIEYGDSVKLIFTSGFIQEQVAFVNNNIMNSGSYILKSDENSNKIIFQIQDDKNSWDLFTNQNLESVYIFLQDKGKYLDLQKALANEPNTENYHSRPLRGGQLKYLDIFRGPNPNISKQIFWEVNYYNQSVHLDKYINLDENPYNVHTINLKNEDCNKFVIETLKNISSSNAHVYLYSKNPEMVAYMSTIIEALAGASYEELVNDYMETYKNLYGINKEENESGYNAIKKFHIDAFLQKLTKTPVDYDLNNCDFAQAAENYLRSFGANSNDINLIKDRILYN